jgi:putative sterol carrier protein
VRFLGPAWLAALDQALSASPAVAAATADVTLSLLQVVTGGPDGDVAHLVSVGAGRVRVASATADTVADVTMASTWDTAVAIATGALAPHDAFTTGHLVVRGDIEALRAGAPALAGLHEATESLRAATTY